MLVLPAAALLACGGGEVDAASTDVREPAPAVTVGAAPRTTEQPDRSPEAGRSTSSSAIPGSLDRLLGQKIMVAFRGSATPPASLVRRIERGHVGGVILFTENVPADGAGGVRRVVRRLRAAALRGGNPPLLVATDQEGGEVRRVPGPPVPSARDLGGEPESFVLRAGADTGRSLRGMSIDVDLAPVVDLPTTPTSFLGSRTFSTGMRRNTRQSVAFARGLQRERVAATAKHYPGLGSAGSVTTDVASVRIDASRATMSRERAGFVAHVRAGVRLMMMSNATYDAYDPRRPAVISRRVIGQLRADGFRGVVISDELNVPALRPYGPRVSGLATAAGVDILLYANTDGIGALDALRRDVRAGRLSRRQIERQVARIIALKRWLRRSSSGLEEAP